MEPAESKPSVDRDLALQFLRQLYEASLARYGPDHEQTLLLSKYVHASGPGLKAPGSAKQGRVFRRAAV